MLGNFEVFLSLVTHSVEIVSNLADVLSSGMGIASHYYYSNGDSFRSVNIYMPVSMNRGIPIERQRSRCPIVRVFSRYVSVTLAMKSTQFV